MTDRIKLVLCLGLALLLAACGGGGDSPATSAFGPAEHEITGVVQDATMNTVTLQVEGGVLYTFSTEGAQEETGVDGLTLGATVRLTYTGELVTETQQQAVTLTKLVVTDPGTVTDTGTILEVNGDTIKVQLPGGTYTFKLDGGTEVDAGGSLGVDDKIEIAYTGVLDKGRDVQAVTVNSVVVTAGGEHSITGVITDASMNMLILETQDGAAYAFPSGGATFESDTGGLEIGDEVELFYTGTLSEDADDQPVQVTRVVVQETPGPRVQGTVVDATMNTLTVLTGDGYTYTFATENITAVGSIKVGGEAKVWYSGTLNNEVQAQQVAVTRIVGLA